MSGAGLEQCLFFMHSEKADSFATAQFETVHIVYS
jgi:hypothetical protein